MLKTHLLKATLFLSLGLMLWPGLGCAKPVGPELRANQFFPFELAEGDQLVYQAPSGAVVVEGPATVKWEWINGELFLESESGRIRVRPLEEFPHEEMTEQMIASARSIYENVPFIEEYLAGNPSPTDQEWASAYTAWLDACGEFSTSLKNQFKNDARETATVVLDIADLANQHELVVPGTVEIVEAAGTSDGVASLLMAYKGMPLNEDGSYDKVILDLSRDWHEPTALPIGISREDALLFHHGINTLFESSSGPLFIDISQGLSVSTSRGRQ